MYHQENNDSMKIFHYSTNKAPTERGGSVLQGGLLDPLK